jgi:predicted TIM-barrel fold metal-dependent hydrolase
MLIDVHAHFHTKRSGRAEWAELNARRLAAGERIGITAHVASILGSWGGRSPTYFPSPDDVTHANDAMGLLQREHAGSVFGYCVVNPNYTDHALSEIERRLSGGMVGIKLAASRRADDPLLDPIAARAAEYGVPILHHVWHDRGGEWPGQEASDAVELARLAQRHPAARFILAHLGGGGDWSHSLSVLAECGNIWADLSGSGVDVDMMHEALDLLGPSRLVWGTDVTIGTGWGKLRYLEDLGLAERDLAAIRYGNAVELFPPGTFDDRN